MKATRLPTPTDPATWHPQRHRGPIATGVLLCGTKPPKPKLPPGREERRILRCLAAAAAGKDVAYIAISMMDLDRRLIPITWGLVDELYWSRSRRSWTRHRIDFGPGSLEFWVPGQNTAGKQIDILEDPHGLALPEQKCQLRRREGVA